MIKRIAAMFLVLCFLLSLLDDVSNVKTQPFRLMLTSQIEYPCVFDIREDGFLEVVIGPWKKGKMDNFLECFGEKAVRKRKRLSATEISLFNGLIENVKMDGDSEMDPGAVGMSVLYIFVAAEGEEYQSLYHNFGPFSTQECVQELAYKLIQNSPIITPYSEREAIRFYGIYGGKNKAINGKFKNLLNLIEQHEDDMIIDKDSERYKKILKEDWGELAMDCLW